MAKDTDWISWQRKIILDEYVYPELSKKESQPFPSLFEEKEDSDTLTKR